MLQKCVKRNIVLMLLSLMLILSVRSISAQCGADGTQPCGTTSSSTKTKSKPVKSLEKNKPSTSKSTKANQTISKNPLFYKLLGKWKNESGDTITFLANGTGKGYDKDSLCASYFFTLKGNILDLSGKFMGKCLESDDKTFSQKLKIRFDEANRLWVTKLLKDGSEDGPARSAIKIK